MTQAAAVRDGVAPFPVDYSRTTPHGLRLDIQVLRALAIILVLLHHAHFLYAPGGFLGVDIFFVVSGYLMTGIIGRELDERRFRFGAFYARRIKRLLPAAYATLVVTAIAAPWLLDAFEYKDFIAQLAGSFTFVANVVLWKQSDYFNTDAALKPLLHMWSLAIEEQYYIALPLLLFLTPARYRLAVGVLLTIGSGLLCAWFLQRSPSATFYFLPFRAWELGLGSVTALAVRKGLLQERAIPGLRLICGAILIAVPMLLDERGHPGLAALCVCLATAVLMIPGADLRSSRLLKPFVGIGDRSYSLYLVHWPIYAFANNIFIQPVPGAVDALLLVPCLIWMELQYRLVEQPFRKMKISWRSLTILALVPIIIVGASLGWQRLGAVQSAVDRTENVGFNLSCLFKGDFAFLPECQSAPNPKMLAWGDSYSIHLVGGLAASATGGVAQATRPVCGPFLGIAPTNDAQFSHKWAENCIAFNDSVVAALTGAKAVDTVVISSALNQYVPGGENAPWQIVVRDGERYRIEDQSVELLLGALARTAAAVRAAGKHIVLITPPPSSDFDIARCDSRVREGKPTVSQHGDCSFSVADYHRNRRQVLAFLAEVERRKIVPVLSFDTYLCGTGQCRIHIDGSPIYRDHGHLSIPGSKSIGLHMKLGEQARAMAR